MKIGLLVQPHRGVVAIRGHVGDGRALTPVTKVVLDVQVVSPAEVEEVRAGRRELAPSVEKCQGFARELEELLHRYGVSTWGGVEVQT